jgi:hypothetical protein
MLCVTVLVTPKFLYADPAYLYCTVTSEQGETIAFATMFDETSGSVTQTSNSGDAFSAKGSITASSISYQRVVEITGIVKTTFKSEINRTTLVATQATIVESATNVDRTFMMRGPCQLGNTIK